MVTSIKNWDEDRSYSYLEMHRDEVPAFLKLIKDDQLYINYHASLVTRVLALVSPEEDPVVAQVFPRIFAKSLEDFDLELKKAPFARTFLNFIENKSAFKMKRLLELRIDEFQEKDLECFIEQALETKYFSKECFRILLQKCPFPPQELIKAVRRYILRTHTKEAIETIFECFTLEQCRPYALFFLACIGDETKLDQVHFDLETASLGIAVKLNRTQFVEKMLRICPQDCFEKLLKPEPIIKAIRNDNAEIVKAFLTLVPNQYIGLLFQVGKNDWTVLEAAMFRNKESIIKALFQYCPENWMETLLNTEDGSPLFCMGDDIKSETIDLVISCCPVKYREKLFANHKEGKTLLRVAAEHRKTRELISIITHCPPSYMGQLYQTNRSGKTALTLAGNRDAAQTLLDYSPKGFRETLFQPDLNGVTPLQDHFDEGDVEITKYLVENFQPLNFAVEQGEEPDPEKDSRTSYHIKRYGITKQERLVEIAKIAAQNYPWVVSEFIQNYGILNENDRIEIAKIASKKDGNAVSFLIKRYEITNKDQLFEIAKIAAAQNPKWIISFFQNYEITNPEHINQILEIALPKIGRFLSLFGVICTWDNRFYSYSEYCNEIRQKFSLNNSQNSNIRSLKRKTYALTNPELHKKITDLLNLFATLCELHPNRERLEALLEKHPKLLPAILEGREVAVMWPIFESILMVDPKKLTPNTPERQMGILPLLTMHLDETLKDQFVKKLLQYELRDMRLRNPLIRALDFIKNDPLIEEYRAHILHWLLNESKNKDELIRNCKIIIAIYELNGEKLLYSKNISFEKVLSDSFKKKIPEFNNANDISDALLKTFYASRNPTAIFTYAGCLSTLSDLKAEAFSSLALFITSVLDGTFKKVRQDPERNLHLKRLPPQILEQYHQGSVEKFSTTEASNTVEPKHIVSAKIIMNAIYNNHITDEMLNIKIPDSEQNFNKIRCALQTGDSLEPSEDPYLQLQFLLDRLMLDDTTEAMCVECYTAFENALNQKSEILNDINSIRKLFTTHKQEDKDAQLYDTDDPHEILLCGTDVDGSCQRIDGMPYHNKGLLGYLLNGSTRLLSIKVEGNNKIKGRAIIRLLLDEDDKPVLFMERIYPASLEPKFVKALIDFGRKKAAMLNIPFLNTEIDKKGKPYNKQIKCCGGLAYEYVDAGRCIGLEYQISGAVEL